MNYPEAFERLWSEYPERPNNPKKLAFKEYQRRIREGVSILELEIAIKEYAYQMMRSGNLGTQFVMQGRTFLGPNERWKEFLRITKPLPTPVEPAKLMAVHERIDGRPFIREILDKLRVRGV